MKNSGNGLLGAALIGVGLGLTAVGVALVIPACTNWSLGLLDEAVRRGRDTLNSGMETAASVAGNLSGRAQKKFSEASKTARHHTVKAATAVENAARQVREHAAS
ncbi:MAG: hypothetical protein JO051_01480 [Acidobacteriaceae bacterium]|nr:hypothetical protein [Acidobacteriaceae bacterium]